MNWSLPINVRSVSIVEKRRPVEILLLLPLLLLLGLPWSDKLKPMIIEPSGKAGVDVVVVVVAGAVAEVATGAEDEAARAVVNVEDDVDVVLDLPAKEVLRGAGEDANEVGCML